MGKSLTRKIIEKHLVVGEYVQGKEIGIKIDQTLNPGRHRNNGLLTIRGNGPKTGKSRAFG